MIGELDVPGGADQSSVKPCAFTSTATSLPALGNSSPSASSHRTTVPLLIVGDSRGIGMSLNGGNPALENELEWRQQRSAFVSCRRAASAAAAAANMREKKVALLPVAEMLPRSAREGVHDPQVRGPRERPRRGCRKCEVPMRPIAT